MNNTREEPIATLNYLAPDGYIVEVIKYYPDDEETFIDDYKNELYSRGAISGGFYYKINPNDKYDDLAWQAHCIYGGEFGHSDEDLQEYYFEFKEGRNNRRRDLEQPGAWIEEPDEEYMSP